MNTLRKIFRSASFGPSSSRFERYYGNILQSGSGFPTADEARKDLSSYDRSFLPYSWPR